MARVYFDSNVFSNLRRRENPKYVALEEAITKYKSNLVFVYSHAHIRDKINDSSRFKYDDFEYMQKWVNDNYLSYHATKQNTSFYLANPLEVFQDNDALDNINYVMEILGSYKDLRALIEGSSETIPIGSAVYHRSELFKDGQIQARFADFIKATLHHPDKSKIPYYDFYLQSYSVLDMFGFCKDKLSKKNTFNNIFNDSLHSYYARYCDYLVTEDGGLAEKSSMLYKDYGVVTEILSVDEFIQNIDFIGQNSEDSLAGFFNKIGNDLIKGSIVSSSNDTDSSVFIIRPFGKYLNFFDQLQVLKIADEIYVFLTKQEDHYLSGANYRETQMIIDKMLTLLDDDLYGKSSFAFEQEVDELRNDDWKGRYWEIGDTQVNLHMSKSLKELCVQIGPFTRWIYTSRFRDGQNGE